MRCGNMIGSVWVGAMVFCANVLPVLAEDNSVIRGKAIFKGDVDDAKYKRVVLDTSKDPNCQKSKPKIGSDNIIINKTDPPTIRNVIVAIESGLSDQNWSVSTEKVVLNQHGCQYEPHVIAMMEGQELLVRNSDSTNHNIHFLPKVNEEFNKTQPKEGMEDTIKLVKEEPFRVKCDVHPWMGAHIAVYNHPFFAVTDKDGTFEIKGVPPGKYVVKAWHEEFGEQTAEVQVSTGETKELDFAFEGK